MKVKDLIAMKIDVDVYDDVCEELGLAYCGSLMDVTDEGKAEFAEVMEYEVTLQSDSYPWVAIVHIDDPDDAVWESKLEKAMAFFEAAAGYCSVEQYERWFT